jgi:hypothetical protein
MSKLDKWQGGKKLTREEEPEYLADLCEYLRAQETLSPLREEGESSICELVQDEVSAHAADVIEELFERIQNLEYELRERE